MFLFLFSWEPPLSPRGLIKHIKILTFHPKIIIFIQEISCLSFQDHSEIYGCTLVTGTPGPQAFAQISSQRAWEHNRNKIVRREAGGDEPHGPARPRGSNMETNNNKPRPKTVEEWRSERRRKAKREGGFIMIPMEMWNGGAFYVLTKAEKLFLLECMAQLRYAPGER